MDQNFPNRLTPEQQESVLATHAAMIWDITYKLAARNCGVELDDLHAHVQLGFVKAASKFDPTKGLQFSSYAYPSGWREGVLFCRLSHQRGFHVPDHHPFWKCPVMPEVNAEKEGCKFGPDRDRFPFDFWDEALADLHEQDRKVLLRVYRDGMRQCDVAREMGVSRARVEQIHRRGLNKLKDTKEKLEVYLEAA